MNPSPDLATFIEVVADDAEIRSALAQEQSDESFAEACAALAQQRGLEVNAAEVCTLLRARAIAWLQRDIL